jgi:hypothetical protein
MCVNQNEKAMCLRNTKTPKKKRKKAMCLKNENIKKAKGNGTGTRFM